MKKIVGIKFGIVSADDVLRHSVCPVGVSTIYEKNLPKNDGLNDVRMGTVDRRIRCGTCGHTVLDCIGHHGHHTLAVPCYHPCFVDKLYKVLRVVCYFCSALLVTDVPAPVAELTGKERFTFMTGPSARVRRECPVCAAPQPSYSRQRSVIRVEWADKALDKLEPEERADVARAKFTPYRAWLIMRGVTAADCASLGLDAEMAHPEAYVIRTLLVPPPCIRPSIMVTEGSRSLGIDDLTRMLQDVVKLNLSVKEDVDAEERRGVDYLDTLVAMPAALEEKALALQTALNLYFKEDAPTGPGAKGGNAARRRNLAHRLKGKEGRVRGNLSGKRVDYSARTVISPESQMDVHELGIPPSVAFTLTVTEVVCPINHQALVAAVRAGPNVVGGAKALITAHRGEYIRLDMCERRERIVVNYGDRVERNLRDGDWVVFNRQPSLHKLSLIGLRARIVPGKTFRLSVPVTTGFNADFDGEHPDASHISLPSTGGVKSVPPPSHPAVVARHLVAGTP